MTEWPVLLKRGSGNVGVVLVHDISGLDETNLMFGDMLQKEGFHVAHVDMFRGKRPPTLEDGFAMRQALKPADLTAAMRHAHAQLKAAMGGRGVIGAMGFCMGGGVALHGACHEDYAFCVDYYGRCPDAEDVRNLKGPVLLILASEDENVNSWAFGTLLPKIAEHRKRIQVQLYPAVVHPFHRPDWVRSPWGGMKAYDEAAATDAWRRAVAFIRENAL